MIRRIKGFGKRFYRCGRFGVYLKGSICDCMEEEGLGTVVVVALLGGVVGLAIRSLVKQRKAGKNLQCGMDCSQCNKKCH
jgi:hypothetical protein